VAPFGDIAYVFHTLFLIPGSTDNRLEVEDMGNFFRRGISLWIPKDNPEERFLVRGKGVSDTSGCHFFVGVRYDCCLPSMLLLCFNTLHVLC